MQVGYFCPRSMAQPPLPVTETSVCTRGSGCLQTVVSGTGLASWWGNSLPGAQDSSGVCPGPLTPNRSPRRKGCLEDGENPT